MKGLKHISDDMELTLGNPFNSGLLTNMHSLFKAKYGDISTDDANKNNTFDKCGMASDSHKDMPSLPSGNDISNSGNYISFPGLRRSKSCRQSNFHRNHHRKKSNGSRNIPYHQRSQSHWNDTIYLQRSDSLPVDRRQGDTVVRGIYTNRLPSDRKTFDTLLSRTQIRTLDTEDVFPRISVDTLHDILVNNIHKPEYPHLKIIDCRFSYEFKGGHIRTAINISNTEELESILLTSNREFEDNDQPTLIIFHCEFSSHRGPTLASHLRNCDRIINQENYPNLYYPDILILEGGYKGFYDKFPELCYPISYVSMDSQENLNQCEIELNNFRKRSKQMVTKNNSTSKFSMISNPSSPSVATAPINPFLDLEPPPRLSFLHQEVSNSSSHNYNSNSDDTISSSIASSSMSINKMLFMDEVHNSGIYVSAEEGDPNEYYQNTTANDDCHSSTSSSPQKLIFRAI